MNVAVRGALRSLVILAACVPGASFSPASLSWRRLRWRARRALWPPAQDPRRATINTSIRSPARPVAQRARTPRLPAAISRPRAPPLPQALPVPPAVRQRARPRARPRPRRRPIRPPLRRPPPRPRRPHRRPRRRPRRRRRCPGRASTRGWRPGWGWCCWPAGLGYDAQLLRVSRRNVECEGRAAQPAWATADRGYTRRPCRACACACR
jgi:hypothetical protein